MRSKVILSLNVSIACQKPVMALGAEQLLLDQACERLLDQLLAFLDVVEDLAAQRRR